jgi:nicotinamide-nucleotide amidase
MHAEIISIGSEIASGQNLDTNSQWVAQQLAMLGIQVRYHTTVADNLAANIEVFMQAAERSELVISTGGLGPTQDDLTREALADAADVELVFHQELMDEIAAMFASRGRPMPERNRVQAYLPDGAAAIPNANGTAPGIWMRIGEAWLAALPGVPREMKPMFFDFVRLKLIEMGLDCGVTVIRKLNTFGAGESMIESQLLDITVRGRVPEVGITAHDAVISLRIMAHAATDAEAENLIAPTEALIRERLGDMVFGIGDEQLEDAVLALLRDSRQTLATAESVTGGLVAQSLVRVPGASEWFRGGIVAYVNEIKRDVLGVPEPLLREHGAVSAPVVEAMATGARKLLGSDLAIATSGIAGPTGATATKPVGLVWLGLAWEGGVRSMSVNWFGNRAEVQSRAAKSALNMVRLHLLRNDQ